MCARAGEVCLYSMWFLLVACMSLAQKRMTRPCATKALSDLKRALYSVKGEAANSRGCQCRNTQAACTGASAKLAAQAVELATNRMFVRSKAVSRKRDPSASQQSLQNQLFFQPIISEMRFLSIFGFILFSQKVLFAGTFAYIAANRSAPASAAHS